jgi:hypothetical protein
MVINAFKNIMKAENINDLCSLLNFVWKSLKNNMISKDVLIKLLDSILECVRVEDLKKILAIVRERLD